MTDGALNIGGMQDTGTVWPGWNGWQSSFTAPTIAQQGWQCASCKTNWAPWIPSCHCQAQPVTFTFTNTAGSDASAA